MLFGKTFCVLILAPYFVKCIVCSCVDEIIENGVSSMEADQIVKRHNEIRLSIANGAVPGEPRGVNLKRIKWDDKLAKAAQDITNKCIFGHVKVTDNRWQVGQSTAMSSSYSAGATWLEMINAWYDEYKEYKYGTGFSTRTGHYTQLVWANTQYVGCGYTLCKQCSGYKKLYVCNYGPGGNFEKFPYRSGTSGCENLC